MVAPSRTTKAPRYRLDEARFKALCLEKDAETEAERAVLVGAARSTVRKWIRGDVQPLLPKARQVARTLGSTDAELWPEPN